MLSIYIRTRMPPLYGKSILSNIFARLSKTRPPARKAALCARRPVFFIPPKAGFPPSDQFFASGRPKAASNHAAVPTEKWITAFCGVSHVK